MKCVMCLIGNVKIFYSVDENDALYIQENEKRKLQQLDTWKPLFLLFTFTHSYFNYSIFYRCQLFKICW